MTEIVCVQDLENHARQVLPKATFEYCSEGAGSEYSLKDNRKQFLRYRIRPRVLQNVAVRDISTTVLGENISMPIGISPTGMQKVGHPDGECATVRAAQSMGTIFTLSTASTSSIEEVAAAAPLAIKWFQLYVLKDLEITKNLVKRAEAAGFKAIVLTVDLPILATRRTTSRNGFFLPRNLILANFEGHPTSYLYSREEDSGIKVFDLIFHSGLQWSDIKWLQSLTSLPIIVKGILTAEDAVKCVSMGVAGIVVSNHGGRQLDTTVSPLEALAEIVKAVGDKVEIYIDGGIREGVDVFKALALGAKMVFVGRPAIWGLAYAGEEGVQKMLSILKREFDETLALTGCSSVLNITPDMVVHKSLCSQL